MSKKLKELGLLTLLETPDALHQPNNPELSEIRVDVEGSIKKVVFKIKETRLFEVYDRNADVREDGVVLKKYNLVRKRSVTVLVLHSDGCLEVRIPLQTGNYKDEIRRAIGLITLFKGNNFSPVSLNKAKVNIWNNRSSLSSTVRFSNSYLRNSDGFKISASTGSKVDDLASNKGAVDGLQGFLSNNGDYEGLNIWFKQQAPNPTEDIHVILNGEMNEFAIPANCDKADYLYVLAQLKQFNK